jgi:hypothetical protein
MENVRLPNISPEQAVAALMTGLKEGGYREFSRNIALDAKMFGDIVFYGIKSLFPGIVFFHDGEDLRAIGPDDLENENESVVRLH